MTILKKRSYAGTDGETRYVVDVFLHKMHDEFDTSWMVVLYDGSTSPTHAYDRCRLDEFETWVREHDAVLV